MCYLLVVFWQTHGSGNLPSPNSLVIPHCFALSRPVCGEVAPFPALRCRRFNVTCVVGSSGAPEPRVTSCSPAKKRNRPASLEISTGFEALTIVVTPNRIQQTGNGRLVNKVG